jgi:AraC-like DNA-binding protein
MLLGIDLMLSLIQKMINLMKDYARYFPDVPSLEKWGLWISGSGTATILPGYPYPPGGHPPDHQFDWEKGRSLDALQIVLITQGQGWLETRRSGTKAIESGMAFLLLPGVWHRYRPDPSTGWSESWIEIRGSIPEGLIYEESSLSEKVVRARFEIPGLEEVMRRIHNLADDSGSTRPELSAEALRCLALLSKEFKVSSSGESFGHSILKAERYFSEHHAEALDMREVARSLDVSYSSFRRSFTRRTGLSPWQYVLQLRLERARRLLQTGDGTLDDISSRLGFSSAFHLSSAFKKAYGLAPSIWRRKQSPLG